MVVESTTTTFQCKWTVCQKSYKNVEDLFFHLTNEHIGRKSTNNLCLTCQWNNCGTVAAKRDHLASHLRVHLPLKPFKCSLCQKGFKRPQDLKKHEKIHTAEHQATLLSNQPGYKPVRRRRKTATPATKTLDVPKDLSEISSDLSSSHSPSFSLGDNMDLDEDSNVFKSDYNPLQDFIDDVLLNQTLPNYDADMMHKLNSITPVLQYQQDWSLPCEPNAIPALQNWLEKLSANIQTTDEQTIYPNVLTNQMQPSVLLSSNNSRSPSPSFPVLSSANDYDLYPKLDWSDSNISPSLIQKQTPSASDSSAVHTPPLPSFDDEEDMLKPQFWSPGYIHSYTHDEILEKSPLFKQDTLSPSTAIDFNYTPPSSEKATYFETSLAKSNPVVPSLDSSSNVSFVDKKEIVSLMNVFSAADGIKYKKALQPEEQKEASSSLSSSSSVASSVIELPVEVNPQEIKYPSLLHDEEDSRTSDTPSLNLYPTTEEHEEEYTEEEEDDELFVDEQDERDNVKSPYANLVELVGKMKVTEESMQQRHVALINQLLKATSKVA